MSHWQARSDLPSTKAHVLKPGWPRALCGLRTLNGKWEPAPDRAQCGMCQRRLANAHHWIHALGILR
jgi:hypothetical protein